MSEWKNHLLEEVASLVKDQMTPNGLEELAYIGLEHIEEASLRLSGIGQSTDVTSQKFRFKSNDILFGKLRPYFRKVVKPEFDGICSTDIWVIRAKDGFDQNFLYYFFATWDFVNFANSGDSGTRMPRADWNFVKQSDWLFPPVEEQRAIAEVLSSLDDKIDLLHRQNKTLESLAQTLFRQWLIEQARDEWEEGTLADFAYNIRENIQPKEIETDTKYVGLEHIERKDFALHSFGSGSDVESNKSVFRKHDILFGKLRPYFHKVCFAPFDGVCSTDILIIRPKSPELFPFCLMAFFQKEVVDHSDMASEGTRMPRTNWEILSNYPVGIPDYESISRFNESVLPMIEKIETNINQIASIARTRDTLLPKLMNGEVTTYA